MPKAAGPNAAMAGPAALSLGEITPERFLAEYWQKRPLLIRQAGPDPAAFDKASFLDAACREDADARLVTGDGADEPWRLTHGPLDPDDIPVNEDAPWTVLLRHGEIWRPALTGLQQALSFIPMWRHQDVMVSYASPGGSVGPHLDQYDVFLYQGAGKRRWAIGEPDAGIEMAEGENLHFIKDFQESSSWVLEPGDMLYLPPGVPHHGVAETGCFTYSIGFRAPGASELLWALANVLDTKGLGARYADPDLTLTEQGPAIAGSATKRALALLQSTLADPALLAEALALWASDPIADPPDLEDEQAPSPHWRRAPGTRMALAGAETLYVDGEALALEPGAQALAAAIAAARLWEAGSEEFSDGEADLLETLAEMGAAEEPEET